ncbi:uncharacterized protein LOC127750646 [Frankliniella occidentalis]|uniref:Uncharacterized protein LOC127750646 n=1 Tax=Frankliniella occidentalis TaxID=133901 RepID=A0A9C6XRR2_FRAOC|nr:uncharacterized protein LOC127750646 [Frankliniella occidentalis]
MLRRLYKRSPARPIAVVSEPLSYPIHLRDPPRLDRARKELSSVQVFQCCASPFSARVLRRETTDHPACVRLVFEGPRLGRTFLCIIKWKPGLRGRLEPAAMRCGRVTLPPRDPLCRLQFSLRQLTVTSVIRG